MDNAGEDSDNDVVTDFLNSNCTESSEALVNGGGSSAHNRGASIESQNYCIPVINAPAPAPAPAAAAPAPNSNSNPASIINNNMIVLLCHRREHHLHLRCWIGSARLQGSQVPQERQMVQRHSHVRDQ